MSTVTDPIGFSTLVERPSWVYFIVAMKLGLVKIGRSGEPRGRLMSLQIGSPDELVIAVTTPGGERLEQDLHDEFRAEWVRGEWFRLTDRVRDRIVNLGGSIPDDVTALSPGEQRMQDIWSRVVSSEGDSFQVSHLIEKLFYVTDRLERGLAGAGTVLAAETLEELGILSLAWANTLLEE